MDAFGSAVRDKMAGKSVGLRIERDDGYTDVDDLGTYFSDFGSFPACEREALGLARGRVLDIGLGPGRVSLHLQRLGLEAVGVDISEGMLQVARERGVRNAVMMSACDLRFPKGHFQTAVAFGNNFGLCGTPEGVTGMMLRLRDAVSDDGLFLAESVDPLNTANPEHRRYHELNRSRGRMPGQVRIRLAYGDTVGDWFDLLMVTPDEMMGMAERTGWAVERTFYPPDGPVYVCALRKA